MIVYARVLTTDYARRTMRSMNNNTDTDQVARLHIHIAGVLNGAQLLLDTMYRNHVINGVGYYPREIRAQEQRVAMLQDKLDSIVAPEFA